MCLFIYIYELMDFFHYFNQLPKSNKIFLLYFYLVVCVYIEVHFHIYIKLYMFDRQLNHLNKKKENKFVIQTVFNYYD